MPTRFQNFLQDFRAGVRSPRYAANVASEAYAHSIKEARNFIISTQGGIAYREGMEFVSYNATQQPSRLFQFRRGGDVSDIIIEVNAGQTRYWIEDENGNIGLLSDNITILEDEDNPGDLLTDESGNFLTVGTVLTANPYAQDQLESLYFTNQAQYGILCHNNHPPTYITVNSNLTLTSEYLPLERIPEFVYNDYKSPQLVSQLGDWKLTLPAGWAVGGLILYVTYNGVTGNSTFIFDVDVPANNAANIQAELTNAATKAGLGPTFDVVAIDILNYTINITGPDSGYDVAVNPVMIFAYLPGALPPLVQPLEGTGTDPVAEPAWSYPFTIESDGFYFKCIQPHRSTLDDRPGNPSAVNADLYWENLGAVKPAGFDYQNPDNTQWAVDTIYAPQDRGFPTVTVFHEQRLYFMANKDNPTSMFGSGIGQYFDFTPGPNDDEPVLFILDSSDTPQIKWARSQRRLILGTSSGEWTIGSETTITPTDIDAEMQNATRAHLNMAIQVDTEIFYIEQGLRKVRATRYSRDFGTFIASDASLMAEHLVSTEGVTRLVHSAIPETLLTMITTDGKAVFLSYEREAETVAFSEGITDGELVDVISYFSKYENQDYVYFVVKRNSRYIIERMRYPRNKRAENFTDNDVVFMDSWMKGTVTGNTITGLEHLEQKEVFVLIDDAFDENNPFLVTNGTVTLPQDETGKTYAVGLPYLGYLETFEIADNVRDTGLGTKRRWNNLTTRVLNSSLPLIYGDRAPDRRPVIPMGESDNVRAGIHDIEQSVTGYDVGGAVTVIQDRPYPLYIEAFFGQYQVEDD